MEQMGKVLPWHGLADPALDSLFFSKWDIKDRLGI